MKRGSALLIVLGMVAFMVISAVAFSAYMRYSRLPSSYLRRTSSSRQLVKAALAEAIDIVDASIGDDPHPGFPNGSTSSVYPRRNGYSTQRNWWRDRCFIGTNQLLQAEDTVATLTLEGLAHIPPSLINEARYYSRHSAAATWHDMGYDAGRFAFFALDVSDCLNVNRVGAKYGRNSSDLGRMSLAWAFENAGHTGYTVKPSAWDTFMQNYVDFEKLRWGEADTSHLPFVSLADLNLAAYAKAGALAQYVSPFVNYIVNGTEFVTSETGVSAEIQRALNIITDGYYPPVSSGGTDDGNLADPRQQPFGAMATGSTQPNNREILTRANTGTSRLIEECLSGIDMISLYDYLDENDIPASLALPTTERVPMVCGFQSAIQLTLTPNVNTTEEPQRSTLKEIGQTYVETKSFKLDLKAVGGLSTMWMFPFRRDEDAPRTGYSAETALRICFGTETPGLRTSANSPYVVQQGGDFRAAGVVNGAICPELQTQTPNAKSVVSADDALDKQEAIVKFDAATGWFNDKDLFWVKKTYRAVSKDPNTGALTFQEDTGSRQAWVNPDFHPVGGNGTGDGGFTVEALKTQDDFTVAVRPYMTITSRVLSKGKTVDLAPASFADDSKYNGINSEIAICNISGDSTRQPILTFAGDKEIEFGFNAKPVQVLIQPTGGGCVFCPDPRWNFAPEDYLRSSQNLDNSIYTAEGSALCGVGQQGRDGDIFMFVSNQGYLQSPAELAFLPRTIAGDLGGGDKMTGNCTFTFAKSDFEAANGGDLSQLPHGNLMWRTYRLYDQDGATADGLFDIGLYDGGTGPRANPYSSSTYVTLSALANTPYSWWAASTNNIDKALEELDAEAFNKNYAFNEMNGKAEMKWDDLKTIAANLNAAMRSNTDGDWLAGWDSLDWAGNNSEFLGVNSLQGTDLSEVDRKFLYGYWRGCFAAKQQLFLIFVRAEPLMMGSGAQGQMAPQLGARAVALVWRNPAPGSSGNVVGGRAARLARYKIDGVNLGSTDERTPHQTRVLFYRQME